MRDKIQQAANELSQFEKDRVAQRLEKAVEQMEEVDLLSIKPVSERQTARLELLHAWCKALVLMEAAKDPKFDADNAPMLNLPPPDVGNAQARKQHEAALAANETKKAQRRTQFLVRNLEERAVESAQRLLAKMFTTSAADQKEIAAIFAATKLPQARQTQLLGKAQ